MDENEQEVSSFGGSVDDIADNQLIESDEVENDENLDDDVEETESEESESEPEVVDSEEIEFNQQKYNLPKTIADAVKSMQKDYTQKTMALAEQRKTFENTSRLMESAADELVSLRAIDGQLAQYDQLDWNKIAEEDSNLSMKLMIQRDALNRQRNDLATQVSNKQYQINQIEQQNTAKAISESETILRRDIKDWSPDLERKIQDFAVSRFGLDKTDVEKSKADSRIYKMLHMAYIGDQLTKKQAEKPRIVKKAEPVTSLTGKGSKSAPNPAKMSDAEYQKWRRQGRA